MNDSGESPHRAGRDAFHRVPISGKAWNAVERVPTKCLRAIHIIVFCFCVSYVSGADSQKITRGMVSSVHPIATEAGLNVLKSGGNAVDAAVAVGLTLGVVDTANSGIGGGCFMLIRLANGKFLAIDGREMAPAAATRDMFERDGKAIFVMKVLGPLG